MFLWRMVISFDMASIREALACSSVGAVEDVEDEGDPGPGEVTLRDKETSILIQPVTFCRAVRISSTAH